MAKICTRSIGKIVEGYILITYLNDFIFCPRSIYFHQLYRDSEESLYHTTFQSEGKAAHKTIDTQSYSTSKHILEGVEVYSHTYKLCGKIDILDKNRCLLTERKKKIKTIYDGYIYQLYGQYYGLIEMGYKIKSLRLYSMDDNKSYRVPLPSDDTRLDYEFKKLIHEINLFDITKPFSQNHKKCNKCIYSHVCDVPEC